MIHGPLIFPGGDDELTINFFVWPTGLMVVYVLAGCYHPSRTILPMVLPDSSMAWARFRLAALMLP